MEAMKNVRGAHVFDLKLLKEFYLVFGIYIKNSFDSRTSIGEGKYHKKTIWLILLGVRLQRFNTDQMTSSPEMRKWFPLIHSPWSPLKENVDQRVTLVTCGICYDLYL